MEILLREVSSGQGLQVSQDTELVADLLTLGSASEQLIQLRGGGIQRAHAVIKLVAGKLVVGAVDKNTFLFNGERVSSCVLEIGAEIALESHRLKRVSPPAGFDVAFELYVDRDLQDQALESVYITSLAGTHLAKRLPSYLLAALVIIVTLLWPLSAHLLRDASVATDLAPTVFGKQGGADKWWSTGPLLPAHQLEVGDDCSACHKRPFQQVQDEACTGCHSDVSDHLLDTVLAHQQHDGDSPVLNHATDTAFSACQSCHKEHNEPAAMIVTADSLCVDCHQQPLQTAGSAEGTLAVTGFDVDTHANFKLNYLLPERVNEGTGIGVEWYHRLSEAAAGEKEMSNLKFPHDVHLDADKVQISGRDDSMVCSDCHSLKSDNEHFEKITMEQHCASCHDLSFDVADPDRVLPHGNARSVVQSIEEHFVRVYTDPDYKTEGSDRRRRPGRDSDNAATKCLVKPFECGMQRAITEAGIQFSQRGCITCHEVSDNQSEDIYARWSVMPVKINHDWYRRAQFDHASHLTQRGKTENQVCSSCHEAEQSEHSSDVLIPDIDNCFSCHGDSSVPDKVVVNCVSCHAFHPSAKTL